MPVSMFQRDFLFSLSYSSTGYQQPFGIYCCRRLVANRVQSMAAKGSIKLFVIYYCKTLVANRVQRGCEILYKILWHILMQNAGGEPCAKRLRNTV
jgi:hypothetical protein